MKVRVVAEIDLPDAYQDEPNFSNLRMLFHKLCVMSIMDTRADYMLRFQKNPSLLEALQVANDTDLAVVTQFIDSLKVSKLS